MDKVAFLAVGNTYERIPDKDASLDRSKKFRKVHRLGIYMDVVEGNENIISHIEADYGPTFPRKLTSIRRKKVHLKHGNTRWRWYDNHQAVYGMFYIKFTVTGVGGTKTTIRYRTEPRAHEEPFQFFEPKPPTKTKLWLTPQPLPSEIGYRIEFDSGNSSKTSQSEGEPTLEQQRDKMSNKSAFLSGDDGMTVLPSITKDHALKYEKATRISPRVQITIPETLASPDNMRKVCLNAVKYEDVIQALISDIADDGDDSNQDSKAAVYQSNKEAIPETTNKARHERISACTTLEELKQCMNPSSSSPSTPYIFNIYDEQENTVLEFCFGSVMNDTQKVETLIRFCIHFVNNSIRFRPPSNFKDGQTLSYCKEFLFKLIRDPYVENHLSPEDDFFMTDSVVTFPPSPLEEVLIPSPFPTGLQSSTPPDIAMAPPASVTNFSASNLTVSTGIPSSIIRNFADAEDFSVASSLMTLHNPENVKNVYTNSYADQVPPNRKRLRGQQEHLHQQASQFAEQPQQHPRTQDQSTQSNLHNNPSGRSLENASQVAQQQYKWTAIHTAEQLECTNKVLRRLLSMLNSPQANKKPKNLESLQNYIDARKSELISLRSKTNHSAFAIEVINVAQNQKATDFIFMYLPGGEKIQRVRSSVDQAKDADALKWSRMDSKDEMERILSMLNLPIASSNLSDHITQLDEFILQTCFGSTGPSPNASLGASGKEQTQRFAIIRVDNKI